MVRIAYRGFFLFFFQTVLEQNDHYRMEKKLGLNPTVGGPVHWSDQSQLDVRVSKSFT